MKLSDIRKVSSRFSYGESQEKQDEILAYLQELGYDPASFYQELEMSSRYVDTHRDVSYSNAQVQLHSHAFYELLFCRNSCGAEYLVGTERYRLQRGDIIVVPPGVSHRPLLPEHMAEPYKRYVLWLSPEFVEKMLVQIMGDSAHKVPYLTMLRTAETKWEFLGDLFRNGVQEAEAQIPGWETAVMGNTLILLAHLGRATDEHSVRSLPAEKPELLDRLLAYVEEHLEEKITLENMAKVFWVSQSTVSQTFRNRMGVSFYHYVNQRRLIAAKTLIGQGRPLEAAGHQVGFSDYSTFYRAFKKEYGISPRQFRKMQERDENG